MSCKHYKKLLKYKDTGFASNFRNAFSGSDIHLIFLLYSTFISRRSFRIQLVSINITVEKKVLERWWTLPHSDTLLKFMLPQTSSITPIAPKLRLFFPFRYTTQGHST